MGPSSSLELFSQAFKGKLQMTHRKQRDSFLSPESQRRPDVHLSPPAGAAETRADICDALGLPWHWGADSYHHGWEVGEGGVTEQGNGGAVRPPHPSRHPSFIHPELSVTVCYRCPGSEASAVNTETNEFPCGVWRPQGDR